MGHSKWSEIRRSGGPASEARVEAMAQAMEDAMLLAELRESRGASQAELAARLSISQSRVSRIEREPDVYLSTLRRYVEGLGGRLEVAAVFDDGERVPVITKGWLPEPVEA